VGREIWEDIDWHRGDIGIDLDRNIDIDLRQASTTTITAKT